MSSLFPQNQILQISSIDIERLNEHQLPKLLFYLLAAEASNAHKKTESVEYSVPEQINVPDGGCDGNWIGPIIPNFVPRNKALFQCKAQAGALKVATFQNELARKVPKKEKYIIKPEIKKIFEQKGAYILLWGHHTINWSPEVIREKAEERLKSADFNLPIEAEVLILDSNKIAEWVNKHLSAVRYVVSISRGSDFYLFRTIHEWGKEKAFHGNYYENDYLNKLSTSIIDELRKPHSSIRITGSSGIGKTRFIFETIRKSSKLAYTAVFIDCHDRYLIDVVRLVDYLLSTGLNATLIIDNCPNEMHKSLESKMTNFGLCLVTISHEIEQFGAPTMPINLESDKMRDVVVNMLSEDPYLKSNSSSASFIEKLANYTEGYPLMAELILQERRTLSENDLFTRTKFFNVFQTAENNISSSKSVASALSLFTIIGGSKKTLALHLEIIQNIFLPNLDMADIYQSIDELKNRNILREEGDTIRVVPPPLATALVFKQISVLKRRQLAVLQSDFARLSEAGLLEKFAHRLIELKNSHRVNDLITVLCIPFDDVNYLVNDYEGALLFKNLVDLDPYIAIDIAERSLLNRTLNQLKSDIKPRRDLVIGLEKIAWYHDLFQRAVLLLIRLAAGENEIWSNNATGMLEQLFHLYLSGTSCPAIERLEALKKYLQPGDVTISLTVIRTFSAVFRMQCFTKGVSVSLSDLPTVKDDWSPCSNGEILQYWEEAFFILKEFIVAKKSNFRDALKVLGENLPVISETSLILQSNINTAFKEICNTINGEWNEALTSLKHTLQSRSNTNQNFRTAQQSWLSYLEKGNWPVSIKIANIVSFPGWHFSNDNVDLSFQNAQNLARELIANKTVFDENILNSLMIGKQQQALGFGEVYGKEKNEILERLFDASLEYWKVISSNKNKNSSFLSGVMQGMGVMHPMRDKILDRISKDSILVELLVPLSSSVEIKNFNDLDRIVLSIRENTISPQSILGLIQGLPLSSLSPTKICSCMEQLLNSKPEIAPYIMEVLYIYFFHKKWEYASFRKLIRSLLLMDENWDSDGNLPINWADFASQELKKLHGESNQRHEWITNFFKYIKERLIKDISYNSTTEISKLFENVVEYFENEILYILTELINHRKIFQLKYILSIHTHDSFYESNKTWLTKIPESTLLDWVKTNPKLVDVLLEHMALYIISDSDEWQWEPFILKLLSQSTRNPSKVAQQIYRNLSSFSSIGSRFPYWEKREKFVEKLKNSDEIKLREIGEILLTFIKQQKHEIQRDEKNRKNWNKY